MHIALLEDDDAQAAVMELWLRAGGHSCERFAAGHAFMRAMPRSQFDLLLFDWLLPDIDGDRVLVWLRENIDRHIPVIFVTGRDREEDIVHALEQGADDYLTKPVRNQELLARIAALLRRVHPHDSDTKIQEFGAYRIDIVQRRVVFNDWPVELTNKEFALALHLFRNAGRLLSRDHILESVWGRSSQVNTRTVDTHASRLRHKLDLTGGNGWSLKAIYQYGYRLERSPSAAEAHHLT